MIKSSARFELLYMIIAIPDVNGIVAVTIAKRISFQHDFDDIWLFDGLQWTGRNYLRKRIEGETITFQFSVTLKMI